MQSEVEKEIRRQVEQMVFAYRRQQQAARGVVSENTPKNTSGSDRFIEPPYPRGAAERMTGTGPGPELNGGYP